MSGGWTHSGWFAFCPVVARLEGDSGECYVQARWWWLEWLFWLAVRFQSLSMWVIAQCDDEYEPLWMMKLRPISPEAGRGEG